MDVELSNVELNVVEFDAIEFDVVELNMVELAEAAEIVVVSETGVPVLVLVLALVLDDCLQLVVPLEDTVPVEVEVVRMFNCPKPLEVVEKISVVSHGQT